MEKEKQYEEQQHEKKKLFTDKSNRSINSKTVKMLFN